MFIFLPLIRWLFLISLCLHLDYSLIRSTEEKARKSRHNTFAKPESKPVPKKSEPAVSSSIHMTFEEDGIEEDNVVAQYLPDNESTRLSQADTSKRPTNEDQTTILEALQEQNRGD